MNLSKGKNKPSSKFLLAATTGAVIIATRNGFIALTPDAMREIVAHGAEFADMAELARAEQVRSAIFGSKAKQ